MRTDEYTRPPDIVCAECGRRLKMTFEEATSRAVPAKIIVEPCGCVGERAKMELVALFGEGLAAASRQPGAPGPLAEASEAGEGEALAGGLKEGSAG